MIVSSPTPLPPGDKLCSWCQHKRSAHIYEEGPCRPGFICADGCVQFQLPAQKHEPRRGKLAIFTNPLQAPEWVDGIELTPAVEGALAVASTANRIADNVMTAIERNEVVIISAAEYDAMKRAAER